MTSVKISKKKIENYYLLKSLEISSILKKNLKERDYFYSFTKNNVYMTLGLKFVLCLNEKFFDFKN